MGPFRAGVGLKILNNSIFLFNNSIFLFNNWTFLEPDGSKWVKMDPKELEPGSEWADTGQLRLDLWI